MLAISNCVKYIFINYVLYDNAEKRSIDFNELWFFVKCALSCTLLLKIQYKLRLLITHHYYFRL